jgi:hypothetical protein
MYLYYVCGYIHTTLNICYWFLTSYHNFRSNRKESEKPHCSLRNFFFKIRIVGVESKLGPLGTSATEWPIVPAPGDYDDGEFG